jgi:hypothetical protein
VPPFEQTHVFYTGEDDDFQKVVNELREDLDLEMSDGIPLPFADITCVSVARGDKNEHINKLCLKKYIDSAPKVTWIADRILEIPASHPSVVALKDYMAKFAGPERAAQGCSRVKKWYTFIRYHVCAGLPQMPGLAITAGYVGPTPNGNMEWCFVPSATLARDLSATLGISAKEVYPILLQGWVDEITVAARQAAAISHPMNYIVRVTPALTPKEQRKVDRGAGRPSCKTPHFIVVDHDVLVDANKKRQDPASSHASPVPHHRRGHWRRLGDRCLEAKAAGKERAWVRPSYVGERVFDDGKNMYEVLLDFSRKL